MSRTYRNINVVGNEKSNKSFKKETNKKFRKHNKNAINAGLFDTLINDLNSVSEMWLSNKEYKHYRL